MTESSCGVIGLTGQHTESDTHESTLEWVGVAVISKRASRGVILGVAGSSYAPGPYIHSS